MGRLPEAARCLCLTIATTIDILQKPGDPSVTRLFFLFVAVAAVYAVALAGPFVFDDVDGIELNQGLSLNPFAAAGASPPDSTPFGRPVLAGSLAWNKALLGDGPAGFRLINILFHLVAVGLVFGLALRLLAARGGVAWCRDGDFALCLAAVWALHPYGTAAVTYIVQRAELLMAVWYLCVLYGTSRIASEGTRCPFFWKVATPLACILGVLTKESLVTAPVAALLMDRCFYARSFRDALTKRGWLYGALFASWGVLFLAMAAWPRRNSVGADLGVSSAGYFLMQIEVVWMYFAKVFVPWTLSIDYWWGKVDGLAQVLPEGLFILGWVSGAIAFLKRDPRISFLMVMPLLILAPTSSFVPIVTSVAADHRFYLPLVFVLALCLLVLGRLLQTVDRQRLFVPVCGVLAGVLALFTLGRNLEYRSAIKLWSGAVAQNPRNPRALNNLGTSQLKDERTVKAEESFRRALAVKPDYVEALFNLGTLLGRRGELDEAATLLSRAIEVQGPFADGLANLGNVRLAQFDVEEAESLYRQALALNPSQIPALTNLSIILIRQGKATEALELIQSRLREQPDSRDIQRLLKDVKSSSGMR